MFPAIPGRMQVTTSRKLDTFVVRIGPCQQARLSDSINEAYSWGENYILGEGSTSFVIGPLGFQQCKLEATVGSPQSQQHTANIIC